MAIANVTLTDTFDQWRTKTNQLINVYDETNQLARDSYNATNLAARTASNLAANVITGNTGVYTTIYNNANNLTIQISTQNFAGLYLASNTSFNIANAAILTSNNSYNQANNARDVANTAVANVIAYSNSVNSTINTFTSRTTGNYANFTSSANGTYLSFTAGQTANYANFTSTTNGTLSLYFSSMNATSNVTRTIANNAYDTANNYVANSSNIIAGILASNTAFQNTVNATAQVIAISVIANTDFGSAFAQANVANATAIAAFGLANTTNLRSIAAFGQANTANTTAIAAFNQANTANPTSIAAFNQANNANATAIAAFGQANTVNVTAIAAFGQANTVNLRAVSAFAQANTSYTVSNAAYTQANTAYTQANIVFGQANTAYNRGNTAFTQANAAYGVANTANVTAAAAFNKANTAGGGLYVGNNGRTGVNNNINDIFRINANTITSNITFTAGENASATGPLYVNPGIKIEIQEGSRVAIL